MMMMMMMIIITTTVNLLSASIYQNIQKRYSGYNIKKNNGMAVWYGSSVIQGDRSKPHADIHRYMHTNTQGIRQIPTSTVTWCLKILNTSNIISAFTVITDVGNQKKIEGYTLAKTVAVNFVQM